MVTPRKVRDSAIIDFLEAIPKQPFEGSAWRVVRSDRDPLRGSSPKGRWDDGSFDVLYTSLKADGAVAEVNFHLARGQPLFPSQMEFRLFELDVRLLQAITLPNRDSLANLGIDMSNYGSLGYARKEEEYAISQMTGEAAHFLGADALVVPNARLPCTNAVLFLDRMAPAQISIKRDHGVIDWKLWKDKIASR
jgi:RES domain-containing protein